jgi:hypothetical protein
MSGRTTLSRAAALRAFRDSQTYGPDHPHLVHRHVHIEHDGREAWVDEGVADFIMGLWEHGVDTLGSCERIGDVIGRSDLPYALVVFSRESHRKALQTMGLPPRPLGPDVVATNEMFDVIDGAAHLVTVTHPDGEPIHVDVTFDKLRRAGTYGAEKASTS